MNESSKIKQKTTLFKNIVFIIQICNQGKQTDVLLKRANVLLVSKFKIIKISTGDVSLSIALQDSLNSEW